MGLFKKVYTWREASNTSCISYRSLYQQEINKHNVKTSTNDISNSLRSVLNNIPSTNNIQIKPKRTKPKRNKTTSTPNNNSESTTSDFSIF